MKQTIIRKGISEKPITHDIEQSICMIAFPNNSKNNSSDNNNLIKLQIVIIVRTIPIINGMYSFILIIKALLFVIEIQKKDTITVIFKCTIELLE